MARIAPIIAELPVPHEGWYIHAQGPDWITSDVSCAMQFDTYPEAREFVIETYGSDVYWCFHFEPAIRAREDQEIAALIEAMV